MATSADGAAVAGSGGSAADAPATGGGTGGDGAGGTRVDSGTGGRADAATDGSAAGTGGSGRNPNPTCSDAVLRTGPTAGKEFLKADPIDAKFPFSTHWMGRFSDDPTAVGITGMADYDNDGDLDFSSGQRGGPQFWWEYCTPDHWVQHRVGSGHNSPGGGNAADVDGDGWVDIIAGDSWYRNPKTPRTTQWQRYFTGVTGGAEDVAVGDVSGDGKPDVLWVWSMYRPQWRMPGVDPTQPWPLGGSLINIQTQGGSIGDLDGDGHNDIVVGNQWWYRNVDGKGTLWESIRTTTGFDDSPLTNIGDVDGDGDMDIVMCTHFGGRAAWAENVDGKGARWTLHIVATGKNKLHSIFAMDFDNDGDLDIYSGESSGRAFIWENTDGKGTFVEHVVASNARGHDARVGDVDCDGDLDIAGKPWGEGEAEPRDHIYLQNMTVERGGKAVFQRPKGEVWHKTQTRPFCP
ncbi:MAG TPA: VCBS repeat-containing protein [Polyangia bacterium]|nr:VCBS repeat-containing protein [Polyangia bacterium]